VHAGVVGSVARGDARPDSDVDILIEVKPGMGFGTTGLMDLEEHLSRLLDRRVEVLSAGGLRSPKHQGILAELVPAF